MVNLKTGEKEKNLSQHTIPDTFTSDTCLFHFYIEQIFLDRLVKMQELRKYMQFFLTASLSSNTGKHIIQLDMHLLEPLSCNIY